ncbi:lytic transglycosylase domain-containing protein [Thalassotalea sp. HSM 43]|uniref:lytic transglycosylase domain-containing protein n=1 Tax=Thalassotalea sp. HSM 43 TaxID=2552945 RepID=UPI001080DCE4|nr:lytic transglycosylase domain-containing protein [Thalassotalea sp. HSM 43]QBY03749.1 lytic transglycosylase domain-containing protein [Thalassotalea sp. HSM 43]
MLSSYLFCIASLQAADNHPRVYKYQSNGIPSFSDTQPSHGDFQVIDNGCYACKPGSRVDWHTTPLNQKAYAQQVAKNAQQHKVQEALIRAIMHAESHFQADAVSKAGAIGLMQLMPKTAASMGVKNSFNAEQNIAGGTKLLAHLFNKFNGQIHLVAAAYNAGETAVAKYKGIPPYPETMVYVQRVQILYQRYLQAS